MSPRYPFRRDPPPRDQHRVNNWIRVSRVRVVDENGGMLGEMATDEARRIARERGYDLVEVASDARPPVCKLLDYGKYKYDLKKKQKKVKAKQHEQQVKEIRLRPRTDTHDLMTKLKKAREMLAQGDKVLVTIFFRGREMARKDLGRVLMKRIKEELGEVSRVEHDTSMTGPRMQATLLPKPVIKKVEKPKPKPPAAGAGEAKPAPAEAKKAEQPEAAEKPEKDGKPEKVKKAKKPEKVEAAKAAGAPPPKPSPDGETDAQG